MMKERLSRKKQRVLAIALLILGAAFTVLAWRLPGFDVAYGGEGMHIALEAIQATVCLVVGVFAWLRYLRSRLIGDLAAALAFGVVMFLESAFLLALPTLLNYLLLRPFSVWSSAFTTVAAAVVIAAGAFAGERRVVRRRTAALITLGVLLAVGIGVALILVYRDQLKLPIDPGLSPYAPGRHAFMGDTTILALYGAAGVLVLAAAVRLLVSRRAEDRLLLGWLGPALVVGALASINYALFPSVYSYWVFTGDDLRLMFCLLLTAGTVAELRAAAKRAIDLAVLEERRRLARDLHDGVAQELAFIADELEEDTPLELLPRLPWIRSAAERGLFEARQAIAALTMPLDRPLASAIAAVVQEITSRAGTAAVRLDLDETVTVAPARREEAMLRVAREATTNAVRHGRARTVRVALEQTQTGITRLEIADDGCGVDLDSIRDGFGLTSMNERVAATGGTLQLKSKLGAGTCVEALWTHTPR